MTARYKTSKPIKVQVVNREKVLLNIKTYHNLQNLTKDTVLAYIMLGFPDNLLSISNLCDSRPYYIFNPTKVTTFDLVTKVIKLQV